MASGFLIRSGCSLVFVDHAAEVPHKRSATIEVIDQAENVLAQGRFGTDTEGYRTAERLGSLLREFSDSLGRRCSRYCEHLA